MPSPSSARKIRVLLVDDHVLIRIGLTYALNGQPDIEVVGEAEDGATATAVYRECRPDVVILDLRMPGENGLQTITRLRQNFEEVRILVLTNYGSGDEIEGAFKAGALGFLPKDAPLEVLLESIREVSAGKQCFPRAVSERLAYQVSTQLSVRETEILRLIGKGRNNKEIGRTLDVAEATVKGHVSKLLHKLGVEDRTQAVLAAMKKGLIHLE